MATGKFEIFQRTEFRRGAAPQVTITGARYLGLNLAAYLALGEPTAIEYLYDHESRIIGLRGVPVDAPNGYRTSKSASKHTRYYPAKAFVLYYQLPTSIRCRAVMRDGVLCVDLDQAVPVTSNRAKRPERTRRPTDE